MPTHRIQSLTGLRGVASLWVAAYHLLLPAAFLTGISARFIGRGYLAVDLFFVLSGFVLARTYGDLGGGLAGLAGFLWRRWARIFPLYGLILVARLAYTALRYGSFVLPRPWLAVPMAHPWAEIPANLLLVQSWGLGSSVAGAGLIGPSLIGPAWSVSTEWAAYWVFPALAIVVLHRRPWLAFGAAALAAAAVLAAARHGSLDVWDGRGGGPLLRCLGGFVLGMGLWRLAGFRPAMHLAASPVVAWGVCLALLAGLACGLPDLAIYPLLPGLILVLACGGGPGRLLASGPAVWLGEISYALYLLHIFLLHPLDQARAAARLALPPGLADTLAAGLILALLLAAADLAHRLVERPARRWARSGAAQGRRRTVDADGRSSLTHPGGAPRNLPLPAPRTTPRAPDTVTLRTVR